MRAIKQIPRKEADATPVLSEALLLKNLKHPGIPIVFDLEEDEKNIYVIEEYIAGESLEAFALHQSKISEKKIIQIGIQLCDILIYLHGQKPSPLLYLDMKPEHIFLCAGQVRLVDFGIAAYLDGNRSAYPSYGTKEFSAPEQWTSDQPGVWTDIFGAGRILSFLSEYASLPISRGLGRNYSTGNTDGYEKTLCDCGSNEAGGGFARAAKDLQKKITDGRTSLKKNSSMRKWDPKRNHALFHCSKQLFQ